MLVRATHRSIVLSRPARLLPMLLGALAAIAQAGLIAGCAPAARLKTSQEIDRAAPVVLETANGRLSPNASQQILQSLARQAGVSQILLHHVAVEEAYTDSPLVMGNAVQLLDDGDATYASMDEAIRSARHHINLEVYTFADDRVGREVAGSLISRLRDGVEVNILYDSVGCIGTSPEFFDVLRNAGARLVEFNPVSPAEAKKGWKLDHRDHRKLLIIDNRVAFTGGLNFADSYSSGSFQSSGGGSFSGRSRGSSKAGPSSGWRDTHVRIQGPVVAEFQKLFRQSWEKQGGEPVGWDSYFPVVIPTGTELVRAIGSTPDDAVSRIHTTLLSAIGRAERSVYITQAYFVPDQELIEAVRASARRGVDVQLVLPGEDAFWMTRYAGRSHFRTLLEAGARLYEREGPMLHAKTVVIDGVWSTVGSTNFDYRSLAKNDEINAVILGEDVGSQLEALFREDIASSKEITLAHWKRRGPSTRIKELMARAWERLL